MTIQSRWATSRTAIILFFGLVEANARIAAQPASTKVNAADVSTEKVRELAIPDGAVGRLAFSPDGHILVAEVFDPKRFRFDQDIRFRTWRLPDYQQLYDLKSVPKAGSFTFSSDSKLFILGTGFSAGLIPSSSGTLHFFDANTGTKRRDPIDVEPGIQAIACSPDGKTIALGGPEGVVRIYDFDALLNDRTKRGAHDHPEPECRIEHDVATVVWMIAYSADGRSLATVGTGQSLKFWNTRTHDLRYRVPRWVATFALSPNNDVLATQVETFREEPTSCTILRLKDGFEIGTLTEKLAPLSRLAFSHDGRFLATGDSRVVGISMDKLEYAGEVKLWDAQKLRLAYTLDRFAIAPFAFSPKDGLLATFTKGGSVAIWKVTTRP